MKNLREEDKNKIYIVIVLISILLILIMLLIYFGKQEKYKNYELNNKTTTTTSSITTTTIPSTTTTTTTIPNDNIITDIIDLEINNINLSRTLIENYYNTYNEAISNYNVESIEVLNSVSCHNLTQDNNRIYVLAKTTYEKKDSSILINKNEVLLQGMNYRLDAIFVIDRVNNVIENILNIC